MTTIREKDGSLWKYGYNRFDEEERWRRYSQGEILCPVCYGDGYENNWSIADEQSVLEPIYYHEVNIGSRTRPYYVPSLPACTFCEGDGWIQTQILRGRDKEE